MEIPMLRQCCCGCTLKTGSIIIAVLNMIAAIYYLAIGIVLCTSDLANDENKSVYVAVGAILATVGALVLLAGFTLFVGAMKEIPNLLIPYMVLATLSIITNVITSSIAAANLYRQGFSSQGSTQVASLIIYFVLQTYFLLVVYSLYRQLKGIVTSTSP